MPKLSDTSEREIQAALALRNHFHDPDEWRHASNGNLWRSWDGQRLTIFRRYHGFKWCIAFGGAGCRGDIRSYGKRIGRLGLPKRCGHRIRLDRPGISEVNGKHRAGGVQ